MHGTAVFLALALVSSTIFFSQYKSMSELGAGRSRAGSAAAARRARDDWRALRAALLRDLRPLHNDVRDEHLPRALLDPRARPDGARRQRCAQRLLRDGRDLHAAGRQAREDRFGCRRMIRISLSFFIPAILLLVFTHNLYLAGLLLLPIVASLYFSYSPMVVLGQQYLSEPRRLRLGRHARPRDKHRRHNGPRARHGGRPFQPLRGFLRYGGARRRPADGFILPEARGGRSRGNSARNKSTQKAKTSAAGT